MIILIQVVLYFSAIALGLEWLNDVIIQFQKMLTSNDQDLVWAPTGFSYFHISAISVMFTVWLVGLLKTFFSIKLDIEFPGSLLGFVITFGIPLVLIPSLLFSPFTLNYYEAADDRGFYHNPYWGWSREVYPWAETEIILDYNYYGKNSKGPNVGPHYILRSGNRKYDLGKSLLNNKPSGKRQLEALRQIDRLAQKHGVPIKVRRSMGTEMEQIMRNDPDMDDEEVDFLMQLFAP
ncbi:hypothetical protein JOD24_002544 [Kroppenstedtia sanguinis]|uniref:hypothetical protein n=1 Tax=Kroppenstedtia sanguinis TaxID=1380684 RepID=UPI00039C07E4